MSTSHIVSLRRMRSRLTHSPWGVRLLAVALVLGLVFAFTPCCDAFGAATGAGMPTAGSGSAPGDHGGGHAPDNGDPCSAWLDRSDAVAVKADNLVFFIGNAAFDVPSLSMSPPVPARAPGGRVARLPIPPPATLYLRYARLIL